MKLIMAGIVAGVLCLTSCGNGNSVSPQELAGTWKGETTTMPQQGNATGEAENTSSDVMSCTPTLTFSRADDTRGGKIFIIADFTVTKEIESSFLKDLVNATVSGTAKASGTWIIEDGDDVKLILESSETKVDVDTASLTLAYTHPLKDNKDSKDAADSLSMIRQNIAMDITGSLIPTVTDRIQSITKFEDVSVADNIMTLEIGNNMITFTKQ